MDLELKQDTSLSGEFFLGIGGFQTSQEVIYYFYTEDDKGAIQLCSENASAVKIYEDGEDIAVLTGNNDIGYTWAIHIPDGSIQQNYDATLK